MGSRNILPTRLDFLFNDDEILQIITERVTSVKLQYRKKYNTDDVKFNQNNVEDTQTLDQVSMLHCKAKSVCKRLMGHYFQCNI